MTKNRQIRSYRPNEYFIQCCENVRVRWGFYKNTDDLRETGFVITNLSIKGRVFCFRLGFPPNDFFYQQPFPKELIAELQDCLSEHEFSEEERERTDYLTDYIVFLIRKSEHFMALCMSHYEKAKEGIHDPFNTCLAP